MIGTLRIGDLLRKVVVELLSTGLFTANYVLAPLGVIWVVANTPSSVRGVAALLGVPAIWMLPSFTAALLTGAIYPMHGENTKSADIDWVFGILIGSAVLTAVWFLPAWENSWTSLAETLAPLRVSSMFDRLWLMGLSWIACIPLMISTSLGTATDNIEEKSSPSETAQTDELDSSAPRATKHAKHKAPQHSDDSDQLRPTLGDLEYDWKPAPNVGYRDVGGQDELKKEITRSVLRPLTRIDEAYERFNVSPPNGILLYGPPGTGKTLFARAIAGELGHPYLELSAGDIKSRWINESTEQVNRLFDEAEQFNRCVIFIDEIDALLAGRGNELHREHAQVVNEFLAHLDDEEPNFLVIAATNRADLLDEAATRRGRFDQQYEIGLPDHDAREAIFRVRLRELPTALDEDDYQELADRSEELSSADIVGIVDDAAMHAAERDAEAITLDDLHESFPDPSTDTNT
ncbi:AAA family ATPase [Halobium salinum]|uniref:AAA family ATPase n=1 Tax=Halobium salinum TaxID=1364940 RepID=A0ABD5PH83_9EURY|nr:AAA family ATPase [Halobium salinum]